VPALSILWIMDDHTGGPPSAQAQSGGQRPRRRPHHRLHQPQHGVVLVGDLHGGRTTRRTASTTSTATAAGLCHQPVRGAGRAHRPHLLHAGQHDPDDRSDPRADADEPVRLVASPMRTAFVKGKPRSPTSIRSPTCRTRSRWIWTAAAIRSRRRRRARPSHRAPSSSNAVARLKAAWVQKKREIFAGRLTKPDSEDPKHRQPSELVRGDRVYSGLPRREQGVMHPSEFKISSAPRVADLDD